MERNTDTTHGPGRSLRGYLAHWLGQEVSRRDFLRGASKIIGCTAAAAFTVDIAADGAAMFAEQRMSATSTALEKQKAEFDAMSNSDLARWILDLSGDEATRDRPVRTPRTTAAYQDLKNTAEGKPAYRQTLLTIDGKGITMDVEINRDILLFRALLTAALRDPANYFEGKPIMIQSGQFTNRSGSHKSRHDKSHFYASSIDFSGALIDGSKSDDDTNNLHPYDSLINRQLGKIADEIGRLVGVKTSASPQSLERVDAIHGTPGLSKGHYHYNASDTSARDHARALRKSIVGQPEQFFRLEQPVIDLNSAGIGTHGSNFICEYETFRGETYSDAGGGRGTRTIGYGATYYLKGTDITRGGRKITIKADGEKPRRGDTITPHDAGLLLNKMIGESYLTPVLTALAKNDMKVTQHQLDALVSYSYHRGGGTVGKLIGRLKNLSDAGRGNDALAVRAVFMYDINSEVAEVFRNGVADRYLDTADVYIRGEYKRENRSFNPDDWEVVIAAYFG